MSVLRDTWEGLSGFTKHVMDALSLGIVAGTLIKMLPAIAALMSIIWTGIRIYEWARGRKHAD